MILNLHQHDLQKKPENFVVDKSAFSKHFISDAIELNFGKKMKTFKTNVILSTD